ncbi:hypothetical protein SD81_037690 [Tolypothrix campylonemoides VB511288]|nr:hypothetical protein SD81_037690 [Tolypothrix campylonemoides VB511288]
MIKCSVKDENLIYQKIIRLIENCHQGEIISSHQVDTTNKKSIVSSFEEQFLLRPRVKFHGLHRHIVINEMEIEISTDSYGKLIEHHINLIGFEKQQYVAYLLRYQRVHVHMIFNRATVSKGNLIDINFPKYSMWNSEYKVKLSYEAIINEYYRAEKQRLEYRRDIERKIRRLVEYSEQVANYDIQLDNAINRINQILRKMA